MQPSRRASFVSLGLLSAIILLSPLAAHAQKALAGLRGLVQDPSSSAIPNATLTLTNTLSGVSQTTVSNNDGFFVFPTVEPGEYVLNITATGFKSQKRSGIVITTGITNELNVQLQVGDVSQSVTVDAGTQTVNTVDATVSGLISAQQVRDLPLNVRSFASLTELEPAVAPGGINTGDSAANVNAGGFVAGQRSFDINYTVDGGNAMQPTWPQAVWATTTNGGISLDAVREFRVFTSNKPADAGGKSGALVAITTKSGGDAFHGSAFEYFRNTVLDTRAFFDTTKQPYHQNQFGGSVGGPISARHQIYFFGSYEGFRSVQPISIDPVVPTPLLLSYVPGGASHGYLKQIMQDTFPAPIPGYAANALVAPASSSYDNGNTRDMGSGRIDAQLPLKTLLTLRYMQVSGHEGFGAVLPTGVPGGNVGQAWTGDNGLVRLTTSISANKVNEFLSSIDYGTDGFPGEPTPAALVALGFAPNPDSYATPNSALPTITFSGTGLSSVGPASFVPRTRREDAFEVADNFSWQRGRHSIAFGGQFLNNESNMHLGSDVRPDITFEGFGAPFDTSTTGITTGTVYSQTQNLFVNPPTAARGVRQKEYALFVHDNYRVTPRFSLDAGLRWVYSSPIHEAHGYWDNLYATNSAGTVLPNAKVSFANVDSIKLVPVGSGAGRLPFSHKVWTSFAPNVGFNWDPRGSGKTVLSGGYSIAYERPFFENITSTGFNIPYVVSTLLEGTPFGTLATPSSAGTPALFGLNPAATLPYVQYWNLNVQQSLSPSTLFQVFYLGNKGNHLYTIGYLNQGPGYTAVRPNPAYATITQTDTNAISNFNALVFELSKRYSNGFFFQGSYTWSKSLDDSSGSTEDYGTQNFPVDETNRRGEYGPSDFNFKNLFVASAIYDLPYGKGMRFGCSPRISCLALGNWQASAIAAVRSGQAFSLFSGIDNNGDGLVNDRAFLLSNNVNAIYGHGLGKRQYLNPAAVGTIVTSSTTGDPTTRNQFTGPGFANVDFALRKNFPITEKLNLGFTAQAFNLVNHANLGLPQNTVDSSVFGGIFSTDNNYLPRVIQFALRVDF